MIAGRGAEEKLLAIALVVERVLPNATERSGTPPLQKARQFQRVLSGDHVAPTIR